jgi:effector-binding domain-containing protein
MKLARGLRVGIVAATRGEPTQVRGRAAILALTLLAGGAAWAVETPSPTPSPAAPAQAATPSPAPSPSPSPSSADNLGQVLELATRPAAYIEAKAKREEVYGAIIGNLAKIRDAATKAGLKLQGHPIAVFLNADDDGFTYRAMAPLESAPSPPPALHDPIKLGQTPAGKAMKFEHRGEYDDIDSTYDAITAYLDEKGVDAQDVFLEEYLNEPKSADDPNGQVDIYVLLR